MYDLAQSGHGSVFSTDMFVEPAANGNGELAVAVAATGNLRIDALLGGMRWSDGRISYSDPDSGFDYQVGYYYDYESDDGISVQFNGFSPLSAQQQIAMHFALNDFTYTQPAGAAGFSVEGFTNLAIDYVGSGSGAGTIRLANSNDPPGAYAWHPHSGIFGGDAWFGGAGASPIPGNHDWQTMLHEVGHSLGLKHGHEIGGPGNTALPYEFDSVEYTVMTYRSHVGGPTSGTHETWGAPQTYMMLDIAALQYLYGADFSTNSGNTVYTWNPSTGQSFVNGSLAIDPGGNRIFQTIWDGGGNDTYDLANYSSDLTIDLRPGEHSIFSSSQLADLGGGPNGGHARGNVFNALQYNNDPRSLIENAIGGTGHDKIIGNQADNTLQGGAGHDILKGGTGNDRLLGGGGNDRLSGGGGEDILRGGGGEDQMFGGGGNDRLIGGGGNDTLRGNGGNDVLIGGGGNDVLLGGAGKDVLIGGAGDDRLIGNAGTDRFVFQRNGGDDLVVDFQDGIDRLDFRAFDFANKAGVLNLATQVGADVVFALPGSGTVELNKFNISLLGAEDILI